MTEEELIKAIKKNRYDGRYFERLLAIKMFVQGKKIKDIADFLELSYPTVHSWIKTCEEFGLEGLKPNFGGGRPSKLTDEQKIKLCSYIDQEENLNMTDIQNILADKMHIKMCLSSVSENVKKMGYNYGKPRHIFREAPKNRKDIFKKRILDVHITNEDLILVGDESTHHKKIQTGKRVYKQKTDNIKKITKNKFKINIFGAVGINCNSFACIIKNLTEISFSKILINLRQFFHTIKITFMN